LEEDNTLLHTMALKIHAVHLLRSWQCCIE